MPDDRAAQPRVTVVTPSFNQGDYIARTIESVISQGCPNLEYIVIDGGSTDQSVEVIRRYEKHITFWVSEKDRGQSHAINKGMARSTGSILTWLNSDDWFEAGALDKFVEMFASRPDAGVVVGRGVIVDGQGEVVHDKSPCNPLTADSISRWLAGGDFMQPSAAFSRAAWEAAGPVDEDRHIALDVDLWLRMARAGVVFATTDCLLSTSLSHARAKTTAGIDAMRLDCARVIAGHGSHHGYEDAMAMYAREQEFARFKLSWFERNYQAVVSNPVLRALQPLVKRLARREGAYWGREMPPWSR